jgi:DNA-binding transcriptional ArsR family regulator
MNLTYPISSVGELIGEPARTAILIALLGGKELSAGELALLAGISTQSGSAHLSKLIDGGLLKARRQGRNRYYKIAEPEVAYALEALGAISTLPRSPGAGLRRTGHDMDICRARSCYDHLAGHAGVVMTAALENLKVIRIGGSREYRVGPHGTKWFAGLEIDVEALRGIRRTFAPSPPRLDGAQTASGRRAWRRDVHANAGEWMARSAPRDASVAHNRARRTRIASSIRS